MASLGAEPQFLDAGHKLHQHPASVKGRARPAVAVASLPGFLPLLVPPSPREESQALPGERKLYISLNIVWERLHLLWTHYPATHQENKE